MVSCYVHFLCTSARINQIKWWNISSIYLANFSHLPMYAKDMENIWTHTVCKASDLRSRLHSVLVFLSKTFKSYEKIDWNRIDSTQLSIARKNEAIFNTILKSKKLAQKNHNYFVWFLVLIFRCWMYSIFLLIQI